MPDYESMILDRQERLEIIEDDPEDQYLTAEDLVEFSLLFE